MNICTFANCVSLSHSKLINTNQVWLLEVDRVPGNGTNKQQVYFWMLHLLLLRLILCFWLQWRLFQSLSQYVLGKENNNLFFSVDKITWQDKERNALQRTGSVFCCWGGFVQICKYIYLLYIFMKIRLSLHMYQCN